MPILFAKPLPSSLLQNTGSEKLTVSFENNQQAVLDVNHPLAGIFRETLDFLQQNNREAYVETDNDTITDVLIPERAAIWYLNEDDAERVAVACHTSDAMKYLRRDHPEFSAMHAILKSALEKNQFVLLTAKSNFEIVDVRALPTLLQAPVFSETQPADEENIEPITPEHANQLFHLVARQICDPRDISKTCIPFNYPASGCWVRAHYMARMIVEQGVTPEKIWSSAKKDNLSAHTVNDPNCKVTWPWHVAVILRVRYNTGIVTKLVIDPSLASEPITIDAWIKLQTNPTAKYITSPWTWYTRFGSAEMLGQAFGEMVEHRLQLKRMCEDAKAYPPYAHCEVPSVD